VLAQAARDRAAQPLRVVVVRGICYASVSVTVPLVQPAYTIGRYEVAGHLATGGMAEILLGRLVGPAGFERPVVIKRILPHLAREPSFVQMFLDEARIAATVRHPNVVAVHELLHENDELCIIMEYLEGESLSGLLRRLTRHSRLLEPALCAHVIGQAAAGLHSAHETTGSDGRGLGLVHRDVSPQNIFVCYDGTVKVLDFGIAVVRDRAVRTCTGRLRGKHEYMSPEQCRSAPLDRRSDVFSLGVVLYELSTGHRLFSRPNELLVLKAITEQPVPPPSAIQPDYPHPLEGVVLRALARDPDQRFQTALGLRRALATAAQQLGSAAVAEESLASLMQDLFADRLQDKRELLQRLRSGASLSSLPSAEADAAVELPTVTEVASMHLGDTGGVRSNSSGPEAAPAGPRRVVVTAVLALVGAVALGAAWASGAWLSPAPAPVASTAPGAAPMASTVASPSTPVQRDAVTVYVESVPPGASLRVQDELRGTTPLELSLPRGEQPVTLRLQLPGYRVLKEQVVPDVDQRLRLVLVAAPRPRRPASTPARTRGYRRFN
jgi:serine/threonine protein kinase